MKSNSRVLANHVLAATLVIGLFLIATSHAQTGFPVFVGKFTLTQQTQWDTVVLQPGDYTIIIESLAAPTIAQVRDGKGRTVARFLSGIDDQKITARDALFTREKDGQPRVYALTLASPGMVIVYDRALAREAIREASAPQTVPLILAKR